MLSKVSVRQRWVVQSMSTQIASGAEGEERSRYEEYIVMIDWETAAAAAALLSY